MDLRSAHCRIKIKEIPKLSQEEQTTLEGEITLEKAGIALKNMENGKTPGTKGFGAELKKNIFFVETNGRFCY